MTKGVHLGEAEQFMLLAVWALGDEAYGARIQEELERRTGRTITISAIYVTLNRLAKKGFVASSLADPTPVRGGKAKRHYRIMPKAIEELELARARLARMWEAVETSGKLAPERS